MPEDELESRISVNGVEESPPAAEVALDGRREVVVEIVRPPLRSAAATAGVVLEGRTEVVVETERALPPRLLAAPAAEAEVVLEE